MIKRNVLIITDGSEEQMQGIIRGIEFLDTEHQVGIIYGQHGSTEVTEVEMILADLSQAVVLKTARVNIPEHPQHKSIPSMDINVPDGDRADIIKYIKDEYPNIIQDILEH
jgi:hypothetical protein